MKISKELLGIKLYVLADLLGIVGLIGLAVLLVAVIWTAVRIANYDSPIPPLIGVLLSLILIAGGLACNPVSDEAAGLTVVAWLSDVLNLDLGEVRKFAEESKEELQEMLDLFRDSSILDLFGIGNTDSEEGPEETATKGQPERETKQDGTVYAPMITVNFSDVADSAYYAEAVKWAVRRGIANGTSATTFSSNETCTVAQIITFLYRANGSPQVKIANPFTDVKASDYYCDAALWAYQNGLVSGSSFNPGASCSRGMVATYLWKLSGSPAVADSGPSYVPYSISGDAYYDSEGDYIYEEGMIPHSSITISFSAASVKKETLPYLGEVYDSLENMMAMTTEFTPWRVTVISLQPGSTVRFSNDAAFIYTSPHGWTTSDYPEFAALYAGTASDLYCAATDMGVLEAGAVEISGDGAENRWESPSGFEDTDGDPYVIVFGSNTQAGSSPFSDVPYNASYAQAVSWAVEEGITTGTSASTFSPDAICSRAQIVTFLYRAFEK